MSEPKYRVIVPHDLPLSEHANFAANAIREAEAREARREAEETARREKAEAIKASLEQVAVENKERDRKRAEAQKERDAKAFDESLRQAFFESNPQASEADWNRNKQALRDEALKARTLGAFEGRESLVKRNVELLKKSGRYSGF